MIAGSFCRATLFLAARTSRATTVRVYSSSFMNDSLHSRQAGTVRRFAGYGFARRIFGGTWSTVSFLCLPQYAHTPCPFLALTCVMLLQSFSFWVADYVPI